MRVEEASVRQGSARRRRLVEAGLVTAVACVVTGWVWWPAVKGLRTSAPSNLGDPLYFAWQLAWAGHALSGPAPLWTTNAFDATPGNLAFTDAILGYAPLGLLVHALGLTGQAAALAQLNLGGLSATVLAFVGAYALARALGARWVGGLVAGAGFAFAPWRLEQVIHLNVVSTGGMALALALLARGHGWSMTRGHEPARAGPGWVLAGWGVACWQLSVSLAIGVPFAYMLVLVAAVSLVGWWRAGRPALGTGAQARRVLVADGAGGLALLVVAYLVTRPYLEVLAAYPEAKRTADYLPLFSPPLRGLFTAPETSRWWGLRQASWRAGMGWTPEMVLLPGFVLLGLALAGVVHSSWRRAWRITLAVAVVVLAVLALGTTPAGGRWTYLPLFDHLPGWDGLRTPGRMIIWVTLALCLLAAGFVDAVAGAAMARLRAAGRVSRGSAAVVAACAVVLPGLVVLEGRGEVPFWNVATQPIPLAGLPQPVLVLPTSQIADYHIMLWSTEGWPLLTNGGSGFEPNFQVQMRKEAEAFPSAESVDALRRRGVATVVLVPSRAPGTPWQDTAAQPVPAGVTRTIHPDAVVYDLRRAG